MDMLLRSLKLHKIPWIILHNHDYFNALTQTYIDDHFFVFVHSICWIIIYNQTIDESLFVHSICGLIMNEINHPSKIKLPQYTLTDTYVELFSVHGYIYITVLLKWHSV